jgi:hypothetical protein
MLIEGVDAFPSPSGRSAMNDILPPDVAGYDGFALDAFQDMLPTVDELKQSFTAGVGVAGGMLVGLGAERLLAKNLPMVPKATYPVIHLLLGAVAGKFMTGINGPLGVGVAAGFAGLGFVRILQSWLKLDINLSASFDGADLSGLADLLAADDLLPPELQAVAVEERMAGLLGDYGGDYGDPGGMSAVTVEDMDNPFAAYHAL